MFAHIIVRTNKKNKCVSGNGSEKIREGRHTFHFFFILFYFGNNVILCILKGILPFKIHKFIYFPEDLKKILGFTSKFR